MLVICGTCILGNTTTAKNRNNNFNRLMYYNGGWYIATLNQSEYWPYLILMEDE